MLTPVRKPFHRLPSFLTGYWRSDKSQTFIRPCLVAEACVGGTGLSASDGSSYCAEGYEGIFCSQCADGYRRLAGNGCSSCDDTWGFASHAVIWALVFFTPLTLGAIVVYLVGGSKALWGVSWEDVASLYCPLPWQNIDSAVLDGFPRNLDLGKPEIG